MGIASSKPIQHSNSAGQTFPVNGARQGTFSESAADVLWFCWKAVKTIVGEILYLPVRTYYWLTPKSLRSWLLRKLQALAELVSALRDKIYVWWYKNEVEELRTYLNEDREVTEAIQAQMRKLPEAAQRACQSALDEHAKRDLELTEELADLVNRRAAEKRRLFEHLSADNDKNTNHGPQTTTTTDVPATTPAPPVPAAGPAPRANASNATTHGSMTREQLRAQIEQLKQQYENWDTEREMHEER